MKGGRGKKGEARKGRKERESHSSTGWRDWLIVGTQGRTAKEQESEVARNCRHVRERVAEADRGRSRGFATNPRKRKKKGMHAPACEGSLLLFLLPLSLSLFSFSIQSFGPGSTRSLNTQTPTQRTIAPIIYP